MHQAAWLIYGNSTQHDGTCRGVSGVLEPKTNNRELIRNRLQEISHDNRISYLTLSLTPALAYYKALKLRALLRQQVLAALNNADVLLMPTMGIAAPKIEPTGADSKETSNRESARNVGRGIEAGLTTTFSLASSPALSICCGFTKENLPIGLQIGGKPFAEQTILNVAYAYQQATDWHTKRPPI